MDEKATVDFAEFLRCDLRVGTVISVAPLAEARRPAFVMKIDFGPLGVLKSTAQLTGNYQEDELLDTQVVAVVNLPPKQVGHHLSQCLVLAGLIDQGVSLLALRDHVPNGTPIA